MIVLINANFSLVAHASKRHQRNGCARKNRILSLELLYQIKKSNIILSYLFYFILIYKYSK